MCRALAHYIDTNSSNSLKEVRFVIHPEDNDTFWVKKGNNLVVRLEIQANDFCNVKHMSKNINTLLFHVNIAVIIFFQTVDFQNISV